MKNTLTNISRNPGTFAMTKLTRHSPQIAFEKPNEGGEPSEAEVAAAKAAADKAAADAAEKAAADKAAADKAAADAAAENDKDKGDEEKSRLLREVMDKKNKLKDTTAELEDLRAKVDGLDLDKVKELLAAEKDREAKDLEEKGEFERVKAMMKEEHEKELSKYTDKIAQLTTDLGASNDVINELTVGRQFAESKFIQESLVLTPNKTRNLYGSHFELKDGELVAYDKPKGQDGRTVLVNASGSNIGFEEAMKRIIEADPEKDDLLKTKINPGAGSHSNPKGDDNSQNNNKVFGASRIQIGLSKEK